MTGFASGSEQNKKEEQKTNRKATNKMLILTHIENVLRTNKYYQIFTKWHSVLRAIVGFCKFEPQWEPKTERVQIKKSIERLPNYFFLYFYSLNAMI